MKTPFKFLTCSALATLAAASLSLSTQGAGFEADGLGTNWLAPLSFYTYPNPDPMNNPNGAWVPEGNYGSTNGSGGMGGLAQSFILSSGGVLDNMQFTVSGAVTTFNLLLYDLGSAAGYTPAGSASFNPASATSLFPSPLQLTYNAGAGGAPNIMQLTFLPPYGVTLQANELYAVAIEPLSGGTMNWLRGGATTFTGGQAYRLNQFTAGEYGAINGSVREFGLAVTVVPEPGSMALMGLGALAAILAIRRRKL